MSVKTYRLIGATGETAGRRFPAMQWTGAGDNAALRSFCDHWLNLPHPNGIPSVTTDDGGRQLLPGDWVVKYDKWAGHGVFEVYSGRHFGLMFVEAEYDQPAVEWVTLEEASTGRRVRAVRWEGDPQVADAIFGGPQGEAWEYNRNCSSAVDVPTDGVATVGSWIVRAGDWWHVWSDRYVTEGCRVVSPDESPSDGPGAEDGPWAKGWEERSGEPSPTVELDPKKKAKLEAAGWTFGDATDFLGRTATDVWLSREQFAALSAAAGPGRVATPADQPGKSRNNLWTGPHMEVSAKDWRPANELPDGIREKYLPTQPAFDGVWLSREQFSALTAAAGPGRVAEYVMLWGRMGRLEVQVAELLAKGWEPYGPPILDRDPHQGDGFYQAMVRRESIIPLTPPPADPPADNPPSA